MKSPAPQIVFRLVSFVAALFLVHGALRAAQITLVGASPDLNKLLERPDKGRQTPIAEFTFVDAPEPATNGRLTVEAAGDLGFRNGETNRLDFLTVSGKKADGTPIANVALDGKAFFKDYLTDCPFLDGKETEGYKTEGGQPTLCGPNYHNVKESSGFDVFGQDVLTIPLDTLKSLIAGDKTIKLSLTPNPGETGFQGVGVLRYRALTLQYESVPEPSALALAGLGAAAVLVEGWQRRTRRAARWLTPRIAPARRTAQVPASGRTS